MGLAWASVHGLLGAAFPLSSLHLPVLPTYMGGEVHPTPGGLAGRALTAVGLKGRWMARVWGEVAKSGPERWVRDRRKHRGPAPPPPRVQAGPLEPWPLQSVGLQV